MHPSRSTGASSRVTGPRRQSSWPDDRESPRLAERLTTAAHGGGRNQGGTVNFYRCRICGETYLGTKPPSRCPFCGVTDDFFVLTTEYLENGKPPSLSETETADVSMQSTWSAVTRATIARSAATPRTPNSPARSSALPTWRPSTARCSASRGSREAGRPPGARRWSRDVARQRQGVPGPGTARGRTSTRKPLGEPVTPRWWRSSSPSEPRSAITSNLMESLRESPAAASLSPRKRRPLRRPR